MTTILDAVAAEINKRLEVPLAQDKWKNDNATLAAEVKRYRDYVAGKQDTGLNDRMRKMLNLQPDQHFNLNRCPEVVETLANRLQVTRMRAIMAAGVSDKVLNDWLSEVMEYNYFDALQLDTHDAALRDGDSYVMNGWDEAAQLPVLTIEPAFDGVTGMLVVQNPRDATVIEAAAKIWTEAISTTEDMTRINIYLPGAVHKLQQVKGSITPYLEDGSTDGIYPWVNGKNQPIGVPVVQFPARGFGTTGHGKSKLKDVLPLQHGLNATMHSMVGVDLLSAFPINIMIGWNAPTTVEPGMFYEIVPTDAEGKRMKPSAEVAEWLKTIKIHTIQGAVLTEFIATVKFFEQAIDQVGNIPNYRSGSTESGEALKQREAALLGEVRRCHVSFGNAWRRVFELAVEIATVFGSKAPTAPQRWQVDWLTGETRSRLEQAQVISAVSKYLDGTDELIKQAGELLELSPERIDELIEQKEKSKEAGLQAMINQTMPNFGGLNQPGVRPTTAAAAAPPAPAAKSTAEAVSA